MKKYDWRYRSKKICAMCRIKPVKEWHINSKFCSPKCNYLSKIVGKTKKDSNKLNPLHRWVERNLGKPMKCTACGIIKDRGPQMHWANKSHEYKRDLSDWMRLCVKCHSKYDREFHKKQISSK